MRANRGFTLIELIITVAIVSLLATAALPLGELTVKRGREQELRSALREIRNGLDAYKAAADQGRIEQEADASGYPPNLDVLVSGVEDATSLDKKKMYFMRRLPKDPFYPDTAAEPSATWGLRSYASSPEDPSAGDDVYDVHSMSSAKGLDGTNYRDW